MSAQLQATAENWPTVHKLFLERVGQIMKTGVSRSLAWVQASAEYGAAMDPVMTGEQFRKWDMANMSKRRTIKPRGTKRAQFAGDFATPEEKAKVSYADLGRRVVKGMKRNTNRYLVCDSAEEAKEVQSRLHGVAKALGLASGSISSSVLDLDVVTATGRAWLLAINRK